MSGLLVLSLASTGAPGAAGAWTFPIKGLINSWKRLLCGGTRGAGVSAGIRPEAGVLRPEGEGLIASLLRQMGDIVAGKKRNRE